ncbi:hypothetical protein JIR23_06840 [Bradyrhizobium diazoefficiens]|nr:hypothetical protein [Bradyrhizobium diazoefficiens]QQN65462.1 hypothetical protein JIR23_06840 [Bradyrhizobium diazoefficiens]
MTSQNPRSLGILDNERGIPPGAKPAIAPGSMLHHSTFEFPVIAETVTGGWVENIVRGDPALEPAFIAAARRLVDRGAVAISSTCGFSIRHQRAIAASVQVPVVTSSLLLLPLLLRQLPLKSKIGVLTYDSRHCGEDVIGVDGLSERGRVVVGGIEGGKYWYDGLRRPLPPPDVVAIETDVVARITSLRDEHPEIATILLECAAFPIVAAHIRNMTKLPVYDIVDLCRFTMSSVRLPEIGGGSSP